MIKLIEDYWKPFALVTILLLWYFHGDKFPSWEINIIMIGAIAYLGYYVGNELLNIEKMKLDNTDWVKTENFLDTTTKVLEFGGWYVFFVGGWLSNDMFLPSSHGKKVFVVPVGAVIKKGNCFDVRSTLFFCHNGVNDLPLDVASNLKADNDYSPLKKYYLGNTPSGLWSFKPDFVSTSYVQSLHNHINMQREWADGTLASYDTYMKSYTNVRENLDPKEHSSLLNLFKKDEQ